MIATVYGGVDIFLMEDEPNWQSSPRVEFLLISDFTGGVTNREFRRPYDAMLRVNLFEFTATVSDAAARRMDAGLVDYQAQPVAVPFWPGAVKWADRAGMAFTSGLKVAYKADWSQFSIYEGIEPGWPLAGDKVAPLLWGRLDNRKVKWLTPDTLDFDVKFVEQSPAAWALGVVATVFAAGPSPSMAYGTAPRLLPFEVNFDQVPNEFRVILFREQIGFGREPLETVYPQTDARAQETAHVPQGTEIAEVVDFFFKHGAGESFWASNWISAVRLTAAVNAADTSITVADTEAIEPGDWLAFATPAGIVTARILTIMGDLVGLDVALPAMGLGTLVSHLMLMRFDKPLLSVTWLNLDVAEVSLPLVELPPEYTPAADETLGVTLGAGPERFFFYELSRTLDETVFTDRYTGFREDITYGGHDYAQQKIGHGEIRQGLQLDSDEVEVTSEIIPGGALALMATLRMRSPLMLTILVGDLVGGMPTNVQTLFTGEVTKCRVKGSVLIGTAVTGSSRFDRQIPGMLFQLTDNFPLFSPANGLVEADWKFTAKIHGAPAGGYPFSFVLDTLAGSGASAIAALAGGAVFVHWFAGGWIEFGNGSSDWEPRAILDSSAIAAGLITLTLDEDPYPFPAAGDVVVLYPGYDLRAITAEAYDVAYNLQGKFNNFVNFGGHPFLPVANPAVSPQAKTPGGGKK
jgi:hypothetical protein